MKNKKKLLIISAVLVVVCVVGMLFCLSGNKRPAFLTETDWIRDGECGEHISFKEDGEFSYWCSCGSPVDSYDVYDSFEYEDGVITIIGEDRKTSATVIYYDENYLCLYLDEEEECRVFVDSNYTEYTEPGPATFANEGWAALHILGYNDGRLKVAPINYDGDAKKEFEEYIRDLSVTADIEFYSVESVDDNGDITTEHIKLNEEQISHIGEYYTGAFVNFDTEGNVRYVVFYGKTIIQG